MLRFTSSPSEWGLIGVAKRRRGSGNSDRYPNPPRGAASPPASLRSSSGTVQWRVGFPFFQGYLHRASQHSTLGSIGAPNRPADDAAVTANAREPATQEAGAGGSKSAMARGAMESQKKLRNFQEPRAKAEISNSLTNAGYSKGTLENPN